MKSPVISASILSADFANLGADTKAVIAAGAQHVHFDVMDHHFVPNLSFGAVVCKALRHAGITAPIDVHLMVDHPQSYIEPFAKAGANLISFHPETVADVRATLNYIREAGMQTGLAFNPEKNLDVSDDILRELDLVLLMSVNPGFGGQAFLPSSLEKIAETRARLNRIGSHAWLAVDGGIKVDNVGAVTRAGADFLVMGSGLFNTDNYTARMQEVQRAIKVDNGNQN